MKKENVFCSWVRNYPGGVPALAEKMNISRRTPNFWLRRDVVPCPEFMIKLARLGRGAFTIDDIVRGTYRPGTSGQRRGCS